MRRGLARADVRVLFIVRLVRPEQQQDGDVQRGARRPRKGNAGVRKADSPILKGAKSLTTISGPHLGLDTKTSAEPAGIAIEGENKRLTIIQNAAYLPKMQKENVAQ
jgi:hypothetical protein